MGKIYLILRNNYVINRVVGEPVQVEKGTTIMEDIDQSINIGDWYEAPEDVFYRPVTKPNDVKLPKDIEHIWDAGISEEI